MTEAADEHRNATMITLTEPPMADETGGRLRRALSAAARIAAAEDLETAGAVFAREMCGIASADVCTVRLKRPGATQLTWAYPASDDGHGPVPACAVRRRTLSVALGHDHGEMGCVELCWASADPMVATDDPGLTVLRDLASAHLRAALQRDEQLRRLQALDDLTTALRRQVHEYANRMQVLSGLHELGENVEAQRFLAEMIGGYESSPEIHTGQIGDPVVAGTLVALMRTARRRQIRLDIEPDNQLGRMPSTFNALDFVTLAANLVGNALDAVADQSDDRRRVHLAIAVIGTELQLAVRDWGSGVDGLTFEELSCPGRSTKQGHSGVGLTLVREIVDDHGGYVVLEPMPDGTRLTVMLPWT